ncbi:MAG: glycosyltransferase [Haliea sp.]
MRQLNVFIYAQHLSGVGHMVRAQQIGLALARRHRVRILDGGRALPFPHPLQPVPVPALIRHEGRMVPIDPSLTLDRALLLRGRCLAVMLREQRPDVILIEHYPFSKWELGSEISSLLETARQVNPAVAVVASLRDVSLRTGQEPPGDYERRVLALLDRDFDGLLVHADPDLCQLRDYFAASADITIPMFHTGIVAAAVPRLRSPAPGLQPWVVASTGGGVDRGGLLQRVVGAWRQLRAADRTGPYQLRLFSGLEGYPPGVLGSIATDPSIIPMGFDPDFGQWLQGAALSVSCAGYNTCANLLVTGTPSLLLPNPAMSDQAERARLLAASGLAVHVPEPGEGPDPLPELLQQNLGRGRVQHSIRLDGAVQSARWIERLASGLHGQ